MEGRRKALYSYSWQQSPINKHRRANPPDEEKKIFDEWFEEEADECLPWVRDHGLDDKIMLANASCTVSSPPYSSKVSKAFAHASPADREQLQRPERDKKTPEKAHKDINRLANTPRYERFLKETREAIDRIKEEKQRKQLFPQSRDQKLSNFISFPENATCGGLSEFSSLQKKVFKGTARAECNLSDSKQAKGKLELDSVLFKSEISYSGNNQERVEQAISSESRLQQSRHYSDDDSDNELLRLALKSSPIQKAEPALKVVLNEDELSDEALLALLTSSPVPSPKLKKRMID